MAFDFILYILYLYNIYNISIFVKIAYFMCVSFSRSTFLPFYPFHLFLHRKRIIFKKIAGCLSGV